MYAFHAQASLRLSSLSLASPALDNPEIGGALLHTSALAYIFMNAVQLWTVPTPVSNLLHYLTQSALVG